MIKAVLFAIAIQKMNQYKVLNILMQFDYHLTISKNTYSQLDIT
ncbi:hypothetical protein [Mycoplasmopsis cynos]|nr:hypothetical protein [Mycoplasmopsis cynos]UWV81230.1 hypothetical protein NW065_04630 [Mycoplasmopsis cynos]